MSVGACDSPGMQSKMEDKHNLIRSDIMDIEERSPKRMKCRDMEKSEHIPCITSQNDVSEQTNTPVSFFVVCDGHGGSQVADYVNRNLFGNIMSSEDFTDDTELAIANGFYKTEQELLAMTQREELDGAVGCTVACALIVGNVLYIANLGDTEAVIATAVGKYKVLTETHTPDNLDERNRVEKEGGRILVSSKLRLAHPVWNPKVINLGVTRAMGDFYFKDQEWVGQKNSGLIAEPRIVKWNLTIEDEFLIIASDGFWDVVDKEEATQFVRKMMAFDSNTICKFLVNLGQTRNSRDNLTVLLVKFIVPQFSVGDIRNQTCSGRSEECPSLIQSENIS